MNSSVDLFDVVMEAYRLWLEEWVRDRLYLLYWTVVQYFSNCPRELVPVQCHNVTYENRFHGQGSIS